MEIDIKEINNKKEYLDEAHYILYFYKKIIKNPKRKIITLSKSLNIRIIILVLYLVLALPIILQTCGTLEQTCYLLVFIVLILVIIRKIKYNKQLSYMSLAETNSSLKLDDDEIVLDNNNFKRTFRVGWNDVKYILITNNCICFMVNINKTVQGNLIIIPRDYEVKFINILKKLKKKDLIIYNKKDEE